MTAIERELRNPRGGRNCLTAALAVLSYVLGKPAIAFANADGSPLLGAGPPGDANPLGALLERLVQRKAPPAGGDAPGPSDGEIAPPGANGAAGRPPS